METLLFQRINELVLHINIKITENLYDGTLKYDKRIIKKLTIDTFNYKEDGSIGYKGKVQDVLKNVGFINDDIEIIKESILKSKEYVNALNCLNTTYDSYDNVASLDALISKIITSMVDKSTLNRQDIEFLIKTFVKELNNETVLYGAKVELNGIILMADSIKINDGVTIRKPKSEDIGGELHFSSFDMKGIKPSAILNIELLGTDTSELQEYVKKVVTLLRLFRIGSVNDIRYKMYSDSIINTFAQGTFGSAFISSILEKYTLYDNDEFTLLKFWNKFFNIIPNGFFQFNPSEIDYLTISFNRYSDSLFSNGISEKRIASAVMGLEAIFLKSNEKAELKYRLSNRISKIMGLFGYDAIRINNTIKEAYNIRSQFVHGGHLIDTLKLENKFKGAKLEILNENENMMDFIRNVIQVLRISLLLVTLLRNGENDSKDKIKDKFIDWLDDSLIDKEEERGLKKLLTTYKIHFSQ